MWTDSEERFKAEVMKCQLLCRKHHDAKTHTDIYPPRKHGTTTMYSRGHCRCDECREAVNEYKRDYRKRKKIMADEAKRCGA